VKLAEGVVEQVAVARRLVALGFERSNASDRFAVLAQHVLAVERVPELVVEEPVPGVELPE
jgi:hypothetical protein